MPKSHPHSHPHPSRRVAVVIVTWHSATLTVDCLHTLQAERLRERLHGGLEITAVVVDNASGDYPEIALAIRQHGWGDWVQLIEAPHNGDAHDLDHMRWPSLLDWAAFHRDVHSVQVSEGRYGNG